MTREAILIQSGHAEYDPRKKRHDRRRAAVAVSALAAALAGSTVLAVHYEPHAGAWLLTVTYLAICAYLCRSAAVSAARTRQDSVTADQAAAKLNGVDAVRGLVTRIDRLEEPAVGWISAGNFFPRDRGPAPRAPAVSRRLPSDRRRYHVCWLVTAARTERSR